MLVPPGLEPGTNTKGGCVGGPARTRTWDQYIMSVLL